MSEDPALDTAADVGRLLQAAFMVASQVAAMYRRTLEKAAQEDAAAAEEVRRLFQVQADLARPLFTRTGDPNWWRQATTGQVVESYDAALRFSPVDPAAAWAAQNVERQVQATTGVDLREAVAQRTDLQAVLDHATARAKASTSIAPSTSTADLDAGAKKSAELVEASLPPHSPTDKPAAAAPNQPAVAVNRRQVATPPAVKAAR